jgi:hypothetical protein
MTQPEAWHQLMAAEAAYYVTYAAPILARYSANDQHVWAAAAAAAAGQQQLSSALAGLTITAVAAVAAAPATALVSEVPAQTAAPAAAAAAASAPALHAAKGSSASLADADCSIIFVPSGCDTATEKPAGGKLPFGIW